MRGICCTLLSGQRSAVGWPVSSLFYAVKSSSAQRLVADWMTLSAHPVFEQAGPEAAIGT